MGAMQPLLFVWVGMAFVLGAVIGSGLNVCICRIPYEKSILWPGSRCGHCFQPIRWYDNVPLLSYWLLRGRCRTCKTPFSIRYFLIELFTGLVFACLFVLDVVLNVHDVRAFASPDFKFYLRHGLVPAEAWAFWAGHAVLASLLIVTSVCDLDHLEIPLPETVTGTLLGLVLAACLPWPWPDSFSAAPRPRQPGVVPAPHPGFQPWPLWRPEELPAWLAPGTWQLGLATGLAGVLAGMLMLRGVRFLFGLGRGVEGLGAGDADLMMMAGAFLGWQAVLVAFFVSILPGLVIGLGQLILRGEQELPFGPSLALGVLLTLYSWRWIGPSVQPLFFDRTLLVGLGIFGGVMMLVISFALRLLRGTPEAEPKG